MYLQIGTNIIELLRSFVFVCLQLSDTIVIFIITFKLQGRLNKQCFVFFTCNYLCALSNYLERYPIENHILVFTWILWMIGLCFL